MNRLWFCISLISMALLAACSSSSEKKDVKLFGTGEKAAVGPLTYSVVDTQIFPQLGDDPATARTPVNRFYVVQLSVSNSSNADVPIPALTLVDDGGKTYSELGDGTNVPNWLGVIRKVGSGHTDLGNIVFDAPSKHYKLRLTDDLDASDISIDIPLSFVHEQMRDVTTTSTDSAPVAAPDAPPLKSPKK
jgi:hypothetical protein